MKEIEKTGLPIVARFAIQPNMLGFCGENSSQEILRRFITSKTTDSLPVIDTLRNHGFPDLNSFLESISQITELNIFNNDVVTSYWFGNDLTEKTFNRGKEMLVAKYAKYISPDFAKNLEQRLPPKLYLTHLTQVAFIATPDYNPLQKTKLINQCMVAGATVFSVNFTEKSAIVIRDVLEKNEGPGYKVLRKKQTVKLDPDLTPQLEPNQQVAVHLGYVATILSSDEASNLSNWTRKVAETI